MRFNNDDYLKAFPREERDPATPAAQSNNEDQPGDVFDQEQEPEDKKDSESDPGPEGGEDNGNE